MQCLGFSVYKYDYPPKTECVQQQLRLYEQQQLLLSDKIQITTIAIIIQIQVPPPSIPLLSLQQGLQQGSPIKSTSNHAFLQPHPLLQQSLSLFIKSKIIRITNHKMVLLSLPQPLFLPNKPIITNPP